MFAGDTISDKQPIFQKRDIMVGRPVRYALIPTFHTPKGEQECSIRVPGDEILQQVNLRKMIYSIYAAVDL